MTRTATTPSDAELREWLRLAEAATPAPWDWIGRDNFNEQSAKVTGTLIVGPKSDRQRHGVILEVTDGNGRYDRQVDADVRFSAAARVGFPACIVALQEARRELAELREALDFYANFTHWVRKDHYSHPGQDFPAWTWDSEAMKDSGKVARAALAKPGAAE